MKLKFVALIMMVAISSCSFNRSFYQAERIPAKAKKLTIATRYNDGAVNKTILNIGKDFQPVFTDTLNNVLPLDYTVESVVFKNSYGSNLNGWFIKGKNQPPADITLLFLHGNGGNIISHYLAATYMAAKGFQVFIIDYSGYGFSEGKATRMHVLDDAGSALTYIRSRADVQHTKVMIYGQSLGGHLAIAVAQKNESKIDGVIEEGGFSSHKDIAAHMYRPIALAARVLVKEKYSAVRSVKKFHKPVLVIHSSEDNVCPFWMGRKIYDHANSPKSFYEIKHPHIMGPAYYADSIAYKISAMVKG